MSTELDSTLEARGTFSCPICGYDKPHAHSKAETAAYREDQIRNDGWTSAAKHPSESGWYLCMGVNIDRKQRYEDAQLSWFLWVREGAARGIATNIPEVLYFEKSMQRWSLRNALGNACISGAENRWLVVAQPRYWRVVPVTGTANNRTQP